MKASKQWQWGAGLTLAIILLGCVGSCVTQTPEPVPWIWVPEDGEEQEYDE